MNMRTLYEYHDAFVPVLLSSYDFVLVYIMS